ncbi:GAS8-like protein, putative [Plasmodium yoelii]|uniref:GAS8-like protein n=2 Tax=Plasmodium yoelii TaxID=5861 RepID=A0AAE9WR09_PLAYO|nr:GAS8-like protein, putative [Plasmodium yoelii]WBY58653.1 GAS8-like protein [Plasmodium yoelii yoelii]VTZ79525.1 GAS8-like protein, putative [Plasmodium yoelii]|eukprot:XP_022812415.1 GAS8-like protein, putative [Plasmodium yoelii]
MEKLKKGPKKKKISAKKKEERIGYMKELKKINKDINSEQKIVDEINSKINNIDANIFLGYHDIKILKLELKNKEIEFEENKSRQLLSSRKIENTINKYVLKCYESFLKTLEENEIQLHDKFKTFQVEEKRHLSDKEYNKLITDSNVNHINKMSSMVLSQNEIINELNKRFIKNLKIIRENYSKKIDMEREENDKKRQKIIFDLQKEKNENIKKILTEYNEKIINIQNYFKLILDDQLEMIYQLEDEKLSKRKNYFSKKKNLEDLKRNICSNKKILHQLEKDISSLQANAVDYEQLKINLKRIKEKRNRQQNVLTDLKLETNVKKLLFEKISKQYEEVYNQNRFKLYDRLQKILLENYFLETKIKLQNETLEINTIELNKWKECVDPEQNEVINKALTTMFQKFEILKKEVEDLVDKNEQNKENYEAMMHLNYFSNDDLDVLKRENI